MLNSLEVSSWMAKSIQDLGKADFIDIELIILNERQPSSFRHKLRRLNEIRQRFLYNVYLQVDQWTVRRFSPPREDAFIKVDISSELFSVKKLNVSPIVKKRVYNYFSKKNIEEIKAQNLDVIVRYGFDILQGEILKASKYGIWSLHHGDNEKYRGGPAFFWEIYNNDPVSGSILQIINEKLDAGKVIYRSYSATWPFSLFLNRNNTYWKTSHFILRRLKDLHEYGFKFIESLDTYRHSPGVDVKLYKTPTNWQMVLFSLKVLKQVFIRVREKFILRADWHMRIGPSPKNPLKLSSLPTLKKIESPRGHFYADPFLYHHTDGDYLFYEDYCYKAKKGTLSCFKVDASGNLSKPQTVLEKDYHLSYPFVFKHEDKIYMLPETLHNQTIELYETVEFPHKWKLKKVLIENIRAVDSTLLIHNNTYWLFTNVSQHGISIADELFIYYSDSLLGPWKEHTQNPVISDVRRSRGAGQIFKWKDQIIRPGQDCSTRYGYAINLNQITKLTKSEFEEKTIDRLEPHMIGCGALATHTFNFNERWSVLDMIG